MLRLEIRATVSVLTKLLMCGELLGHGTLMLLMRIIIVGAGVFPQ